MIGVTVNEKRSKCRPISITDYILGEPDYLRNLYLINFYFTDNRLLRTTRMKHKKLLFMVLIPLLMVGLVGHLTLAANPTHLKTLKETKKCVRCNLSGARLNGARLIRAQLAGANLSGAKLRGANLRGADLSGANLSGADLRRANLRGARMGRANLRNANLGGANLRGVNLSGANTAGATLTGAVLNDATGTSGQ